MLDTLLEEAINGGPTSCKVLRCYIPEDLLAHSAERFLDNEARPHTHGKTVYLKHRQSEEASLVENYLDCVDSFHRPEC